MSEPLALGRWLNESPRRLFWLAAGTAIFFLALCASIVWFTGYYFLCPEASCGSEHYAPIMLLLGAFFGLIPAVGTGAIGWFIVRGLMEDSRRIEEERTSEAPGGRAAAR